jgi:glycosyltransferase involved in cell wall biosynthesis
MRKFAIVTPYHKEDRRFLERCINSVADQLAKADHILVADGFPQEWIDSRKVRHIVLDKEHGDCGNTPRCIGLLLAAAERYGGIGLLDADNWIDKDHVSRCVEAASAMRPKRPDFVIARRRFMRPDETVLNYNDEAVNFHVDTNCFFFLKGSYHTFPIWGLIPKELSLLGDRIFHSSIRAKGLVSAIVSKPTVNYHCLWARMYKESGEAPPAGAKSAPDHRPIDAWLNALNARDLEIIQRLTGVRFVRNEK